MNFKITVTPEKQNWKLRFLRKLWSDWVQTSSHAWKRLWKCFSWVPHVFMTYTWRGSDVRPASENLNVGFAVNYSVKQFFKAFAFSIVHIEIRPDEKTTTKWSVVWRDRWPLMNGLLKYHWWWLCETTRINYECMYTVVNRCFTFEPTPHKDVSGHTNVQ